MKRWRFPTQFRGSKLTQITPSDSAHLGQPQCPPSPPDTKNRHQSRYRTGVSPTVLTVSESNRTGLEKPQTSPLAATRRERGSLPRSHHRVISHAHSSTQLCTRLDRHLPSGHSEVALTTSEAMLSGMLSLRWSWRASWFWALRDESLDAILVNVHSFSNATQGFVTAGAANPST